MAALTLMAVAVFGYSLVSRRLASTIVTAPIFFAAIGLIVAPVLKLVDFQIGDGTVLLLEAALVMVLFADSSSLDLRRWTREPSLSGRLLGIGMPLTMLAGAALAFVLLPGVEIWQAALIGVMLAPTDAALGQAVVANRRVPAVVRNALNVEGGLNDGLALPFVTIFVTMGLVAGGMESQLHVPQVLALALGGSTLVGLIAGIGGGLLLRAGVRRTLVDDRWVPIALVALAVGAFSAADEIGASGFLAVWVAGLATGAMVRGHVAAEAFHLPEELADLLSGIGFLLLGALLIVPVIERLAPVEVLYAALSLTVVRIVPVAVALLRTGLSPATVGYVGWFGPRGLASIVFASLVIEAEVPNPSMITDVVLLTVTLSLVVHGVTAAWGARRYAGWFERAATVNPSIPEAAELAQPDLRGTRRARRA